MKSKVLSLILALIMCLLTACSASTSTEFDLENYEIDCDLTVVSETIMFSQIINLIYSPSEYENMVFKMEGMIQQFDVDGVGMMYFIVIYDETGCCPYGIELRFDDDAEIPEDLSTITIEALAQIDSGNTYLQILKLD